MQSSRRRPSPLGPNGGQSKRESVSPDRKMRRFSGEELSLFTGAVEDAQGWGRLQLELSRELLVCVHSGPLIHCRYVFRSSLVPDGVCLSIE